MRFLFAMMVASLLTVSPALAQQGGGGAANPAVTGVIKSFDGKTLVLDAKDGAVTTVVTSTTRITVNVPKKLTDIKPGDFIASGGTRGPDGKLRANEIRIFQAPGGEGSVSNGPAGPDDDERHRHASQDQRDGPTGPRRRKSGHQTYLSRRWRSRVRRLHGACG